MWYNYPDIATISSVTVIQNSTKKPTTQNTLMNAYLVSVSPALNRELGMTSVSYWFMVIATVTLLVLFCVKLAQLSQNHQKPVAQPGFKTEAPWHILHSVLTVALLGLIIILVNHCLVAIDVGIANNMSFAQITGHGDVGEALLIKIIAPSICAWCLLAIRVQIRNIRAEKITNPRRSARNCTRRELSDKVLALH